MGIKYQLPYFLFIAGIFADIGNAVIEFGLLEARSGHSLVARRRCDRDIGRV